MTTPDQRETDLLHSLDTAPLPRRVWTYVRLMGPGYMQSAMTLGGGTAFAAIFAGAAFGYQLLWVAPLSMLLGIIVLSAVAYQTLSTDVDPYEAMSKHAGSFFAKAWAVGAVLSSIIWQFAQYALASAMLKLMVAQLGWTDAPGGLLGIIALIWCVGVAMLYGRSTRLVRHYENILKAMVWLIVICFGIVVIRTGIPQPAKLLTGFVPTIPSPVDTSEGGTILPLFVIVAGLAAAVGVNMLFVYPYSLLKRGWGRAHRRLAGYDLIFGMFVPYVIAASLILIASASVLHFQAPELFTGKRIPPSDMAQILAAPDRLGPVAGLWIFSLGITAMALSSISMQMLSSGFACSKLFGWKPKTPQYMIGMLIPAIGVTGAFLWDDIKLWIALPTTVICGALMPLAYIGFTRMQASKAFLGDDAPGATRNRLWIAGMIVATVVLVGGLLGALVEKTPGFVRDIRSALSSDSP